MKKISIFLMLILLSSGVSYAASHASRFESSGEVVSVDPLYNRITIKHPAIKGFSGDEATEFFAKTPAILKGISKNDLVDFTIVDEKGDTLIDKITRTGVAAPVDETLPLGRAIQDTLVATGEAAKTVTSPIMPAHDVVSGTVGATTDATDSVLHDANPDVKKKF